AEPEKKLDRFRYFRAGHPYPDTGSVLGAGAALEMVYGLTSDDLVIFLVSGGGSALFEKPLDPAVALADLVEFNRVLVCCGMRDEYCFQGEIRRECMGCELPEGGRGQPDRPRPAGAGVERATSLPSGWWRSHLPRDGTGIGRPQSGIRALRGATNPRAGTSRLERRHRWSRRQQPRQRRGGRRADGFSRPRPWS